MPHIVYTCIHPHLVHFYIVTTRTRHVMHRNMTTKHQLRAQDGLRGGLNFWRNCSLLKARNCTRCPSASFLSANLRYSAKISASPALALPSVMESRASSYSTPRRSDACEFRRTFASAAGNETPLRTASGNSRACCSNSDDHTVLEEEAVEGPAVAAKDEPTGVDAVAGTKTTADIGCHPRQSGATRRQMLSLIP